MEAQTAPPILHDPELDPPVRRQVRRLPPRELLVPQEYQRLVTNPFLTLALFVVWLKLVEIAFDWRSLWLGGMALVGLVAVFGTLQYHCRDCGRTGWLFHWRTHACDAVVARQLANRIRRWRGPTPTSQAVIWMYVLVCLGIVAILTGAIDRF